MGNYADRAAENLLARSIPEYTDGYVATAPVGNYDANRFDLHDLLKEHRAGGYADASNRWLPEPKIVDYFDVWYVPTLFDARRRIAC